MDFTCESENERLRWALKIIGSAAAELIHRVDRLEAAFWVTVGVGVLSAIYHWLTWGGAK